MATNGASGMPTTTSRRRQVTEGFDPLDLAADGHFARECKPRAPRRRLVAVAVVMTAAAAVLPLLLLLLLCPCADCVGGTLERTRDSQERENNAFGAALLYHGGSGPNEVPCV